MATSTSQASPQMPYGLGEGNFSDNDGLPKGIKKEIVTEAPQKNTKKPTDFDLVTVHYVGTLETDGSEFDSSRGRGKTFEYHLGKGEVIKGLDLGVATMKKGEVAKFTLSPEFAYGDQGSASSPKVPAKATLIFEVELISWATVEDIFGNGVAVKTQLQEGSGWRKPKDRDEVLLSLRAETPDGSLIEERPSFDYVLGSKALGLVGRACDKALQGMLKDERASIRCARECAYGDASPEGAIVTLELREIYEISDVSFTEDKSIVKKQVQEGEDYQTPEDCTMVKLAVTHATDGSVPLSGFIPKTLEFSVGDGEVCDALERGVAKMKKGERALLTVTDTSLAEEAQLGLTGLVADQVIFSLELIGFEKAKFVWEMSEEERLEFGKTRKEKGSELFKAGRFQMALQRYEMVYEWVTTPDDYEEENRETAKQLKIAIELNKAAVYMKLGKFTDAKIEAETVLESDPLNAKANYRLAQVELISENFLEAIQLCRKIVDRDARNSQARELLRQAQARQKEVDRKANAMLANMSKAIGRGPVREPYKDKTMLLADEIDAEDTEASEGDE